MIGGAAVFLLSEDGTASSPPGKIIFVDDDFVDDPPNHKWNTLQEGIDDAESGDTVAVFEGTYDSVDVHKDNITISGEATDSVTITDNATYAVKVVADSVTIQNLTIRGGYDAALYTEYDFLAVRNCRITQDNPKSDSWAVDIRGSNVSISRCAITSAGWGLRFMETAHCSLRDTSFSSIENKSIVVDRCANISIDNVTASDVFCGLRLVGSTTTHVTDSTFTDGKVGLILDTGATDNSIRNCTLTGNAGVSTDFGYGIYLNDSSNNTIASCQIQGNDRGIYAEATSQGNLIHHNNFVANGINAVDHGGNIWNSSIGNYWDTYTGSDTDHDGIGNTPYVLPGNSSQDSRPLIARIQTPPARVWVDSSYTPAKPGWNHDHFDTIQAAIDALTAGGGCYVYNGSYQPCTVDKNISLVGAGSAHVWGTTEGILVTANNALVSGFTVTASNAAIKVQNARWVTIANCSATQAVFGVYLVNANECQLRGLSVHDNQKGIFLFGTVASAIRDSHVHNNTFFGLELSHVSAGNTIASCHIADNGNYGAYLVQQSTGNRFYHNNFIGNTAYDACVDNQWGGAYDEALGNYWSVHQGADGFKGTGQSRPGRDGFVDTAYVVPGGAGATDLYPLRYPVDDPPFFAWVNPDFTSSVPGWGHDHYRSIQMALDALLDHGGCFVYAGTYREQVALDRGLTVTGQSPDEVIVQGGNASGFTVTGNGAVLHQFTVRDCWNDPAVSVSGDNVSIQDCVFADSYTGVMVTGDNVSVGGSEAGYNAYAGAAWQHAHRPVMENCSVYGNNKGVMLDDVHEGLFAHVEVHNNSVYALELSDASNNTVHHVSCVDSMYGAYVDDSSGNLFYFNDFIDNGQHARDDGTNSWDNGTVGNYWQGYDGGSHVQGTYAIPYDIPGGGNRDNHPLIRRAGLPVPSFTMAPSPAFTMTQVSFTDTSIDLDGVIVQRHWTFGDGTNVTTFSSTVAHSYGDNGAYPVTLTVTDDDNETGSITKNITIFNTGPTANMTWIPLEPTDVDDILFNGSGSSDPDGSIVNYTWSFGDNETGYGRNVTHRYMDDGIYTVTLTVTDDDGATDTTSISLPVGNMPPSPVIDVLPEEPTTADLVVFNGSGSSDPDGSIVNYTWSFGDNMTGYGNMAVHRYSDDGTYTATLMVRDDDNDTATASLNITVANVPPRANYTYKPPSPTDVDVVEFTDTSSDPDGSITAWRWEFGDGATSTAQNPRHTFPDNGMYTVNLTVTDDDGATSTVSRSIEVSNVPPRSRFGYQPGEPTVIDTVAFIDDASDPDGSITAWQWDFGDGNTSTGRDATHSYKNDGLYTVTLTVTDNDGATGTHSMPLLVVNMPPIVNFTIAPVQPSDLDNISFKGNATDPDGEVTNYTWSYGDGNTSYGRNTTHRYADNGTYTVTLTATDNDGRSNSHSRAITVANVPPTASFTYEPDDPSTGTYISFRDTSSDPDGTIVNATWHYGDGTTEQDGDLLNHKYDSAGTYQVKLVVTDNDGATANVTRTIEVEEEDEAAGFEFVILIAAIGSLLVMWKRRMGVWRRR
jgi:parallel beta-helix repeat protein